MKKLFWFSFIMFLFAFFWGFFDVLNNGKASTFNAVVMSAAAASTIISGSVVAIQKVWRGY